MIAQATTQNVTLPKTDQIVDVDTAAFTIMLAADALICALDSGQGLKRNGIDIDRFRREIDALRHAMAQA